MQKKCFIPLFTLLFGTVQLSSFAAHTTSQTANNLDSTRVHDLDEVVISSQPKDAYRLRQQPLSATLFGSADMHALHIQDIHDISAFTPSFIMPDYGSRLTSAMYIRGIGSRVNSPSVAIYLDDMPILGKAGMNFHTYSLDRIDVLRGAQGTLYGQNSEGGLVRMYSKNPMYYQGTDLSVSMGNGGHKQVEVGHSQRFNPHFAASVSAFFTDRDGFFTNKTTHQPADSQQEKGAKIRLVWQPAQQWTFDWLTDFQHVSQNGFPYGLIDTEHNTTNDPATNRPNTYSRYLLNNGLKIKFSAAHFDVFSTTSYQYLKDRMLMDQDYLPQDFLHLEQKQLQNALSQEFVLKSKNNTFWKYTFGLFGSYQWLKTDAPVYFDQDMNAVMERPVQAAMYNAMVNAMAARLMAGGMSAEQAAALAAQNIEKAGGVKVSMNLAPAPGLYHTPQLNAGIFHESNLQLTDRLTATLGLRYDYNQVKIDYDTQTQLNTLVNVMGREAAVKLSTRLQNAASAKFSQLLPKFGLTYRLDKNESNLYATVSKGYRAGGYNLQMFSDILQSELQQNSTQRADYDIPHTDADYQRINNTISYKPETSWNYEVGAHLNLFNGLLHADLSAYYMQLNNLQLSVMAGNYGFGRMMVNAGKSNSCGFEVALRGQSANGKFNWSATYSFTRATFKNYTDSVKVNGKLSPVDYSGNYVPYIPAHMVSAHAQYRFPIHNSWLKALTPGAQLYGMGKMYWDEQNSYAQKFYVVPGAFLDADFGRWMVSLRAQNLTNTHYNTFAVKSSAAGTPYFFGQKGTPFQWSIDIKLHL